MERTPRSDRPKEVQTLVADTKGAIPLSQRPRAQKANDSQSPRSTGPKSAPLDLSKLIPPDAPAAGVRPQNVSTAPPTAVASPPPSTGQPND